MLVSYIGSFTTRQGVLGWTCTWKDVGVLGVGVLSNQYDQSLELDTIHQNQVGGDNRNMTGITTTHIKFLSLLRVMTTFELHQ